MKTFEKITKRYSLTNSYYKHRQQDGPIRWQRFTITFSSTANCRSAMRATTGHTMRCVSVRSARAILVAIPDAGSYGAADGCIGCTVFRQ